MPNATTTPSTPSVYIDLTNETANPAPLGARQGKPRQPEREARRAAVLNPTDAPSEFEQTRADLLDLAETSDALSARAGALGLRATARQLDTLSKMLRASRTRMTYQPTHRPVGEAYIIVAVDALVAASVKIGAHA